MAESVDRTEVRRPSAAGAQLAQVLPRHEFDQEHLPCAISLPLGDFSEETLDRIGAQAPSVRRWGGDLLVAVGA